MKKTAVYIILSAAILLWLGACAHEPENPTARYFVDKGMEDFNDANYRDAIKAFEKLRDWYPFSQYTILADLKVADAYFELKEYDQAADAYADFERMHPTNEAIPFIIYRIGLCRYNQLDTVDRDQGPAHDAIETFNRLRNRFPDDEYAVKAAALIQKCRRSLAAHELYVGKFYYKSKHFEAAKRRFEDLISDYPEADDIKLARQYIVLCSQMMAIQAKEKPPTGALGRIWEKLKEPFTLPPKPEPDSPQLMVDTPDGATPDLASPTPASEEVTGGTPAVISEPPVKATSETIPEEIASDTVDQPEEMTDKASGEASIEAVDETTGKE